jgi:hypothetical protein
MFNQLVNVSGIFAAANPTCSAGSTLFGLVPWYQYLPLTATTTNTGQQICSVDLSTVKAVELWLIPMAIFEDLLRVAGMLAVVFVIYGGIRYITSQGEPEATKSARGTILNALIGLSITIVAAGTVQFIASSLGG